MHVQCDAERLSSAFRFDGYQGHPIFPRLRRRLSNAVDSRHEVETDFSATEAAGQLAVDSVLYDLEAAPGNLDDLSEISSTTGLIQGPGGTVTAYSLDYLGPSDSLL